MTGIRSRIAIAVLAVVAPGTAGCADPVAPPPPGTSVRLDAGDRIPGGYLVLFDEERVPADFAGRVARLGGRVERSHDDLGVAVVADMRPDAAAALAADTGMRGVEPRVVASLELPDDERAAGGAELAQAWLARDALADATAAGRDAGRSPAEAELFARQWNLRAIHADDAWAAGHVGSRKVTVAIIDSGVDYLHPELVGLVDLERSISFSHDDALTKAEYPDREPFTDRNQHGTGAAMAIATNAIRLAGVNREATLLAIKIGDGVRPVPVDVGIAAIHWAVKHGADVMAFAGGVRVHRDSFPVTYEALARTFAYAWRKGALSVSPTGQASRNRDLERAAGYYAFPCDVPEAMYVAFTAPTAADGVNGPWANVDSIHPTSNHGAAITVAAPGGHATGNRNVWLACTTSPSALSQPNCRPGPTYTGFLAGSGSSWASATVAGVAAMLVTKYGHNHPDLIRARIIETADDLGAPGWDRRYGWGRVNVARAMDVPVRRGRNDAHAP